MKNKLEMAHEWALVFTQQNKDLSVAAKTVSTWAFNYADAMQAEADKRDEEKASQKRKAIREMLNGDNTFLEKEGRHFDDMEWQPDWSQAPEWAEYWYMTKDNKFQWCSKRPYQDGCNWFVNCSSIYTLDVAPSFNYQGDWCDSLRKRTN